MSDRSLNRFASSRMLKRWVLVCGYSSPVSGSGCPYPWRRCRARPGVPHRARPSPGSGSTSPCRSRPRRSSRLRGRKGGRGGCPGNGSRTGPPQCGPSRCYGRHCVPSSISVFFASPSGSQLVRWRTLSRMPPELPWSRRRTSPRRMCRRPPGSGGATQVRVLEVRGRIEDPRPRTIAEPARTCSPAAPRFHPQ
jgi:hypothetical protein